MTRELWKLGAADLAAEIRERRASSRDVLEAHLARIEAVNPRVAAITSVLAEEARTAADAADEAVRRGDALGPLHGVPFSVKVNVDVAGSPTTSGMRVFADDRPAADAPVIARLRAAGAIPFARTNMPDLGLRWHSESELHGATKNPWDSAVTPGGSSGGEAAAIATGMSPLGIGNDVGGSVRWPSQCCGTTALRPTHGRFPHHSSTLPMESPIAFTLFLTDGPMARHVRDLALALDVAGGQSPLDPWSVTPVACAPPVPLRVAVTTNPGGLGCDATIERGVDKAARALAEAGCVVETVEPPSVTEAHELWGMLLAAETRTMIVPFASAMLAADAMTVIEHLIGAFPQLDLMSYMEALGRRTRVARDWARFFEGHDVLLGPVCCRPPFAVGYDLVKSGMDDIMQAMRLVTTCNLLGLPAAVVPVDVDDGMPQTVQIIASRHYDETCLAAAQMIEDYCGVVTPIDPRD